VSGAVEVMMNVPVPIILVVEDDALIRTLAVEIVEEAGFNFIEAANADEAVAILESRTDIAMVFTDIDMPGSMDGLKLAHAIRNRWPPVKIVMVSGKTHLSPRELPTNSKFFAKPYPVSEMILELRSSLAHQSGSDPESA
jgi:two-component system, response regulator PdtaR